MSAMMEWRRFLRRCVFNKTMENKMQNDEPAMKKDLTLLELSFNDIRICIDTFFVSNDSNILFS